MEVIYAFPSHDEFTIDLLTNETFFHTKARLKFGTRMRRDFKYRADWFSQQTYGMADTGLGTYWNFPMLLTLQSRGTLTTLPFPIVVAQLLFVRKVKRC